MINFKQFVLLFASASNNLFRLDIQCPNAEDIGSTEVSKILNLVPCLAAPLLRLHFHGCFVRGCDGSVLLNSTKGIVAEKDACLNLSLRGYGVIDRVNAKLEEACPGADIHALVVRDSVVLSKGPFWHADRLKRLPMRQKQLPPPIANINTLISMLRSKGLSLKDLVVLSGEEEARRLRKARASPWIRRVVEAEKEDKQWGLRTVFLRPKN